VPGIDEVIDAKARWLGHDLHADVTIAVNDNLSMREAKVISGALEYELRTHLPAMAVANVRFGALSGAGMAGRPASVLGGQDRGHHHAPEPFKVSCDLVDGQLEIVDTPDGERMRLTVVRGIPDLQAVVTIDRRGAVETLMLLPVADRRYQSAQAPAEPHEFTAQLRLSAGDNRVVLSFRMEEPEGHRQ